MAKAKGTYHTIGTGNVPLKGRSKRWNGEEYLELTGSLVLPNGETVIVTVKKKHGRELIYEAPDRRTGEMRPVMWCSVTVVKKGGEQWQRY